MRLILIATNLILLACVPCFGQQAPKASTPRICVANFKTELKQAGDTLALRDRLVGYLKTGALANDLKAEILTLREDSDQKTAEEVAGSKCDFAIYTRALVGKLPRESGLERGEFAVPPGPIQPKKDSGATLVPGLQFTVVRVSSGIPVLIDRVFLDREYKNEEDLWLLLRAEQEKLEKELSKRLSPDAVKPQAN
jgi:hypothetical protein